MILKIEHPSIDWDGTDCVLALGSIKLYHLMYVPGQPTHPYSHMAANGVGYAYFTPPPTLMYNGAVYGKSTHDYFREFTREIKKHLPGAQIWQVRT